MKAEELETELCSMPIDQWLTRRAIVFDWYDGPREGVCCLGQPVCEFYFDLLDERPTPDDLDDRLFRVSAIATGSVTKLVSLLHELGSPAGPVWSPVWKFRTEAASQEAERYVQELTSVNRPTRLVISTRDMIHFRGCWNLDRVDGNLTNWFSVALPHEPTPR